MKTYRNFQTYLFFSPKTYLENLAWKCNVTIKIEPEVQGFLRSLRFEVQGDEEDVRRFKDDFEFEPEAEV